MPSLDTLRLFDAAARHLSFKMAAAELHLTPAAISQRIRQLEADLGATLFHRLTRQVALTEDGAELARETRRALAILEQATQRLHQLRSEKPIVVSTTPTFAEQMLLPVLGEVQALVQRRKIMVLVTDELVEPGRDGVDLAIRQGSGAYPGLRAAALLPCRYVPVCAPQVIGSETLPLVHVQWPGRVTDAPSWAAWRAAAGADLNGSARPELHVSTEVMAIRSALAGQAMALVALEHVTSELAAGLLVLPYGRDRVLPSPHGYHLVTPSHRLPFPLSEVRDWVIRKFGTE
jgi:LysR family glycine cleavage system transcriptional activator